MRRPGRILMWVLVAGLSIPTVSAARDDVVQPSPDSEVRRLLDLAAAGRDDELASRLDGIRERSDWSHGERERVLYRFATGVRHLPAERVPVAQLEILTDYESRVLEAHPESRGALMVPRFDIAGAAAGSIEQARRRLEVRELAGQLATAPADFWREAAGGDSGSLAPGVQTEIVTRAAIDTLQAGRPSLATAWRADPRLTPAMAAVAVRLGDAAMAEAVLARGAGPYALRLVGRLAEVFSPDQAAALLTGAVRRPALASAAVMELGRLARRAPAARDWLVAQLDDTRHGASAAAALARLGEPSVVDKAVESLVPAKTEAGLRNRLLLLHLSGTPSARGALSAFAEDPAMPAVLRREVRQWQ